MYTKIFGFIPTSINLLDQKFRSKNIDEILNVFEGA